MSKNISHLPVWINWIAQDANGNWWGYSAEPHQHDQGWYENEVGDCMLLQRDQPNPDWRLSLQKVSAAAQQEK
ncbi:MAG: hypothetical protein PVG13_11090 [Thiohalophilus sp.]|jgi:hypothetical protein